MKTAVVTGDQGFIGQHLVRCLKADHWTVIGYDLKRGYDLRHIRRDVPPADVCYHLAAQTNARADDVVADAEHNIIATLRVLQAYRDKVVFASSCAINYPVTPYAISKLTCEHYCRLYGARIVRLCNIHGPGGHGVFEAFAAAQQLHIAGDGTQLRTYAHVSRAVEAFLRSRAALHILRGIDLTVNEIADLFPSKPRVYTKKSPHDLAVGVQVY